jgi:von Willebrand factor type A domain
MGLARIDPERPTAMPRAETSFVTGESPLTDPRSLASTVLFHGFLLLLFWLVVLNAAMPATESAAQPIRAEIGPVDNRADANPNAVAGEGGGSPGEMGGLGKVPLTSSDDRSSVAATSRDPADALLAEILPGSRPSGAETLQKALPGPQTIGQGLIPGSGTGGGGGTGGGSGGGVGRGIGPGTQFFGARDHAHSFAYVIDCSGSMATRNSLEIAKRELLASLNQLPPDAEFTVVFYNLVAKMLSDPQGHKGLMAATTANKARIRAQLAAIVPDGGTDHMSALRAALALKPEVIFFLTDADLMTNGDVNEILSEAGTTRIQAVEFGRGVSLGERTPLRRLATTTGGAYLYIDVSQFPRSEAGY